MKTRLSLLPLCLVLGLAFAPVMNAQSADATTPPRDRGPGGGRGGPDMDNLATELGLSAEQKAKLEPILKAQREQQQAIRQDESLSREQRMEKSQALRAENRKAMAAVLTPEQLKKFAELRKRGGERGEGEHGGDRPNRGGKGGEKPAEKPADK